MGDTGHTCLEGPGPCPYCEWESLEEEVREQNAEIARLKAERDEAVRLLREVAKRGNGMDMRIAKEVENFLAKRKEG